MAHRAVQPRPPFRDLLVQAEFISSLHDSQTSPVAFSTQHQSSRQQSYRGRGRSNGFKNGRSYSRGAVSSCGRGQRSPHCQLCRQNGHCASSCPDLATYAKQSSYSAVNLGHAFHVDCKIKETTSDWYVNSGATAYMAPSPTHVDSSTPYP